MPSLKWLLVGLLVVGCTKSSTLPGGADAAAPETDGPPPAGDAKPAADSGAIDGTAAADAASDATAGDAATDATAGDAAVGLQVTPTELHLRAGDTAPFQARLLSGDAAGASVNGQATWMSSDTKVATVDSAGQVTGVAAGTATITASYLGVTASATVVVRQVKATSLMVTPAQVALGLDETAPLQALLVYDDGSSKDVSGDVTWQSSSPAVAQVDKVGVVTAKMAGLADVTATHMTFSATVKVTVSAAELADLAIAPTTLTLAVGQTGALILTGSFDNGTFRNVTTQAKWFSSDPAVATVGLGPSGGEVRAKAVGTTIITGEYLGFDVSATVMVQ